MMANILKYRGEVIAIIGIVIAVYCLVEVKKYKDIEKYAELSEKKYNYILSISKELDKLKSKYNTEIKDLSNINRNIKDLKDVVFLYDCYLKKKIKKIDYDIMNLKGSGSGLRPRVYDPFIRERYEKNSIDKIIKDYKKELNL